MKYLLLILLLSSFALAECSESQIDINSATIEELNEINGVGPATAEKIIEERPFGKLEDLDNVYGIGEKKLADIIEKNLACVGDEEKIEEKVEKIIKTKIKPVVLESVEEKVIFLGDEKEVNEENYYTSKNWKVGEFLPYGFGIFLILIIILLFFKTPRRSKDGYLQGE
jgi:competence ComEA-like helix-hairpin-helix protein